MELPESADLRRHELERLIRKIREDRGLDLLQYRTAYVERRLAARMRVAGVHGYRMYERYLDEHPEEYSQLLDTLTINVTEFFRDPTVFDVVRREVIPELLEHKTWVGQRGIRVWSAGCSTGEEAYSIAMTFLAVLSRQREVPSLTVFGTDIDPNALAVAKAGRYEGSKVTRIPAPERRYIECGQDGITVSQEVRQRVRFRRLNLFADEPIKIVDAIFCRNVFIYFTREQQTSVLERFWSALQPGGFLVLGRTERIPAEATSRFEVVSGRERVYRKPYGQKRR